MSDLVFHDDPKLFALIREELYLAVLCDALDQAGHRKQAMRAEFVLSMGGTAKRKHLAGGI